LSVFFIDSSRTANWWRLKAGQHLHHAENFIRCKRGCRTNSDFRGLDPNPAKKIALPFSAAPWPVL
jgi:hypothetical protein